MKTSKIFALLVLLVAIGVMGYSGFRVYEADQVYKEGNAAYDDLRERVKDEKTTPPENPSKKQSQIFIPEIEIDYEKLKVVNNDAVAWLYCPDTVIDYPVMKAKDYTYYLRHLPDGTYNVNGTLFIDYNNAPDFSDPLTVIYGHHMKSGAMFGSLKGYKGQAYYEQHPFMYLYTEQGNYRIDIIYGCVIGAGQWSSRGFMFPENVGKLVDYAADNTTFKSKLEYIEGDRIVALSTCSYEFDNARYVVLGIIRSEF
jgi:sortase B